MEEQYIPKHLNAQPQILWWDADEFGILLICIVIGIMIEHQFIALGIGIVLMKGYTTLKGKKQEGFGYHKAYSIGLYQSKKFPPFWVRRLVR